MYANPILFPQTSNREDWCPVVAINDDDTGGAVDLSALTFQFEMRLSRQGGSGGYMGSGVVPYYDPGCDSSPIITASLGNGITVLDVGVLQISILETQMRSLSPGTYQVACTCTDGTNTRQLFIGRLPVIGGGVSI